MFFKNVLIYICPQKVEKTTWAAETAQTEEFMLQNVAYRPTVHRTGRKIAVSGV